MIFLLITIKVQIERLSETDGRHPFVSPQTLMIRSGVVSWLVVVGGGGDK